MAEKKGLKTTQKEILLPLSSIPSVRWTARKIKLERIEKGLTQKQLAEKAGVTVTTISNIERFKVRANSESRYKISNVLTSDITRYPLYRCVSLAELAYWDIYCEIRKELKKGVKLEDVKWGLNRTIEEALVEECFKVDCELDNRMEEYYAKYPKVEYVWVYDAEKPVNENGFRCLKQIKKEDLKDTDEVVSKSVVDRCLQDADIIWKL